MPLSTKSRFPRYLFHSHTPEAIQSRLKKPKDFYVQDLVYGGADGIVTTFAVVAGVSGAQLSEIIVVILGISNVFADGFSMAAGNYMATKVESDRRNLISSFEQQEIKSNPEGEREEVRQIYRNKGLEGDVLEGVVDQITADKKSWIRTMLSEEYGIAGMDSSAFRAALVTF